jgi:hypothetical protein
MKKALFSVSLMLLALVSIQGCDAISSATSKDFTINIVRDLDAGGTSTTLAKTDTADLTQISSDFAQYKDHVTSLTVDSAWYQITQSPTPSDLILQNGTYSIAAPDGTQTTLFSTVTNVNLISKSMESGETALTVNPDAATKFASLLKNSPNKALIILNGLVNRPNFYFKIKLHIRMKMTANVL